MNTFFIITSKCIEYHTKSIEELEIEYEDEKNSMIAITESGFDFFYIDYID